MAEEIRALHENLIASLKERGELSDPRLEAAFRAVPRHIFLPDLTPEEAYTDEALPVKRDADGNVISSSSQPTMMALMLRQLALQPGHNVLEIGAGTGYNAALIQHLVGSEGVVTSVEIDGELVELAQRSLQRLGLGRVRIVHADGAGGYAPRAAYDRIIATAGVWDIPRAWVQQLKPHGLIVAPLWLDAMQLSAALHLEDAGTLFSSSNLPCGFIRLRGSGAGPAVHRRVGNSPLVLTSSDVPELDSAALHALLSDGMESSLLDIRLSSGQYFHGFLTYFILRPPASFTFATYNLTADQQAYGIEGQGFALIQPGSACFVPYHGHGEVLSFGAPDALLALQETLLAWDAAGRPDWRALRLRLYPIDRAVPQITTGRVFTRQDHHIHVWQQN
jgi:protein-L-isoaspartate(D-aspartate) O-methyltransferase